MAFETVTLSFKKAKDVPVGGSIEGYVLGQYNGGQFPEIDCLKMKLDNGENIVLSPNGSLKYFFKNGNELGYYYKFTRLEDQPVKNRPSMMSAKWLIQVDRSRKVDAQPAAHVEKAVDGTEQIPF